MMMTASAATPTTERRVVNTIGLRNFIPILWAENAVPQSNVAISIASEPNSFLFSVTAPGAGNYP